MYKARDTLSDKIVAIERGRGENSVMMTTEHCAVTGKEWWSGGVVEWSPAGTKLPVTAHVTNRKQTNYFCLLNRRNITALYFGL